MNFSFRNCARFRSLVFVTRQRSTNTPSFQPTLKDTGYMLFHRTKIPVVGKFHQIQCRNFFLHWMNSVFNKYSKERVDEVGPDRACAEWLLRNGAFVQWMGAKDFVTDYNELPLNDTEKGQYFIKAVDATNASIMAMGFPYFDGCKNIEKINFIKCQYLTDDALPLLSVLSNSLKALKIINCWNFTSDGILSLTALSNLKTLELEGFVDVDDKAAVKKKLMEALPNCVISFDTKSS